MQENQPQFKLPQDKLLAELITKHKDIIWKIHDHDSLLENQVEENLTEEERKAAWDEYENEKKGIVNMTMQNQNSLNMNLMMRNMNPELIKVDSDTYFLNIYIVCFNIDFDILGPISHAVPAFDGRSTKSSHESIHDANSKWYHWANRSL